MWELFWRLCQRTTSECVGTTGVTTARAKGYFLEGQVDVSWALNRKEYTLIARSHERKSDCHQIAELFESVSFLKQPFSCKIVDIQDRKYVQIPERGEDLLRKGVLQGLRLMIFGGWFREGFPGMLLILPTRLDPR